MNYQFIKQINGKYLMTSNYNIDATIDLLETLKSEIFVWNRTEGFEDSKDLFKSVEYVASIKRIINLLNKLKEQK